VTTYSMIGDSQSGGLEPELSRLLARQGWAQLYAQHIDGADSARIRRELLTPALAAHPEVLLVNAGGNEPSGEPVTWGQIVEAARARGARVVWIGPPASPADASLDAQRRAVSELQRAFFATKASVRWIDGRATAAGLPRAGLVHLTAAGYRQWASVLAGVITGSGGWAALGIAAAVVWGSWKLAQRTR
jgi:lysophospholipase L1-like esterase